MNPRRTAVTYQAVALLLGYPDEQLFANLPVIGNAVDELPDGTAKPVRNFIDHLTAIGTAAAQREYVATFDQRSRCCLYLTWWTHGDTRERGKALVQFKEVYRDHGLTPPDKELPDHLSVVLEFAATSDLDAGRAILSEHRPAIELLRSSLAGRSSPYVQLLDVVVATLPAAGTDVRDAVRRIAAAGPPREKVGLEPFPTGGSR